MTLVPTLETDRLILRGVKSSDFEPFADFFASKASRFIGGPLDRVSVWRALSGYAGSWFMRGYGEFALEEKVSGKFAGLVGPWFPEGWPEPEIAWTIIPEFQGKGFAKEAALRSLRFAYQDLGWKTACSCIDADNTPSIKLAESLGAICEGETEIQPHGPALLYRHRPPSDFLGNDGLEAAA